MEVAPHRMAAAGALILFGAGEHAQVAAEVAQAAGWCLLGVIDARRPSSRWNWLGDEAESSAIMAAHPRAYFHIAFGSRPGRVALAARNPALPWATLIHPAAVISPSARIAPGALIAPLALVHANAVIGAHAIINSGALVEHDGRIGDFAHVAPGAVLGGGVCVGARAMIGLGARVRDHVAVGDDATVGMGAVVVGQVAPGRTVVGCPARERAI